MKLSKKHLFALTAAFALGSACAAENRQVEWVDRIAIVVNNDIITERDITDLMGNIRTSLPEGSTPGETRLRQMAVDELIDKKLMLQLGRINNITAADAEIAQQIAQISAAQNLSEDALYAELAKDGIDRETLQQTIGENIIIAKVTEREVARAANVKNEEIQAFLAQNPMPAEIPEYRIRHILIKNDGKENARLARIRKALDAGTPFEQVAARESQDSATAAAGGEIGWVSVDSAPDLMPALNALSIGAVSAPLQTEAGTHILQLVDVRQRAISREQRFAIARQAILAQRGPELYNNWRKQLRQGAYIDFRNKPY